MSSQWLACPLVAAALLAGRPPAADAPRTIRVTGQGKATAVPDLAVVQTGVVTNAATAEKALAANGAAMKKVMAALKDHDIEAKDVQTSRFDVRPVYKRDDKGRALPEVASYQVTNQVRVKVRQLPSLGEVLDALVQAGSNKVAGVSLSVSDPTEGLDKARARAVADARRRAELYAKEAGVRVGKVQTISERPLPPGRRASGGRVAFARDAASAVPVAAGEDELRARVDVVFALEDARD